MPYRKVGYIELCWYILKAWMRHKLHPGKEKRMPRKPKRGCAYPGCPRLTDGQYCQEHKKIKDRE